MNQVNRAPEKIKKPTITRLRVTNQDSSPYQVQFRYFL